MADAKSKPFTFEQKLWLALFGTVFAITAYLMALHPDSHLLAIQVGASIKEALGIS